MKSIVNINVVGKGKSGAPRRLTLLAKSLIDNGIDCKLIISPNHPIKEIANENNIPCVEIGLPNDSFTYKLPRVFRIPIIFVFSLLKSYKLLYMNASKNIVYILRGSNSGLLNYPIYYSRKDNVILDIDYEDKPSFTSQIARYISLRNSDHVVFQYENVMYEKFTELQQKYVSKKYTEIIPGINLESVNSMSKARGQELLHRDSKFKLIHVGKIHTRKNQLHAVQILDVLVNHYGMDNIELTFLGGVEDNIYEKRIRYLIEESKLNDKVIFINWSDDPFDVLLKSNLVIINSTNEGVPNLAQECMALGVPLIAGKVGGLPSIIQDNVTGILMNNFDEYLWAQKIIFFQKNIVLQYKISENQKEYAKKEFSLHSFGLKYASIIRNVNAVNDYTKRFCQTK